MKIKIKVPGRYLDDELKARDCSKDDILETKDWYGEGMIRDKTGELASGPATVSKKRSAVTVGAHEAKEKKPKAQPPTTLPPNPFAGEK